MYIYKEGLQKYTPCHTTISECIMRIFICDRILENHPYGANDTVKIKLLKAAFNIEFLPIYDCNKSLTPKITSTV